MTTPPIARTVAAIAPAKLELEARLLAIAGELAEESDRALGAEGAARRAGFASAAKQLAEVWQITLGEAHRYCTVGLALRPRHALDGTPLPARYPALSTSVASGQISVAKAAVIVRELEKASPRCSAEARLDAERILADRAPAFTVADLEVLARRARDMLDQDGAEPRDALHRQRRSLTFTTTSDGMLRIVWITPPEVGGMVKAAIDGIVTAELHRKQDSHHTSMRDEVADERTLPQRFSDAAEQLFHHAVTCTNGAGSRPATTMIVRVALEDLRSGLGTAQIDGIDDTISIPTARRLAAEAELIPMVLGGKGEVLDVGHGRRFFSGAQRLALIERDGGCAYGGCTSPPAYAEAHHIDWWSKGGSSDLANGVMLCSFHHHRVHDDGWQINVREGIPYFIPPPWIDPTRRPRRGGRVELRQAA